MRLQETMLLPGEVPTLLWHSCSSVSTMWKQSALFHCVAPVCAKLWAKNSARGAMGACVLIIG